MTEQEKRGRLIALVIAIGLAGMNLLVIVLPLAVRSQHFNWLQVVPVGWGLFLAGSLWLGQNWARWFLVFSLVLNGLLVLPSLVAMHSLLAIMIAVTVVLFFFGTAVILWRSRSVEAYFTRLSPHEEALFSMKGKGSV